MRRRYKKSFASPGLITGLALTLTALAGTAQTLTVIHNFTGSDGANPAASLTLSGNTLYGTTSAGGSFSNGTVFAVNSDGSGFVTLHSFTLGISVRGGGFPFYTLTNSDGANPAASLILLGSTLYGTASAGGSAGDGVVFAVNTNGTSFTNLHDFTGSDGAKPMAGLISSGNILYGSTSAGGAAGYGTVFAITTDGTGYTNLHDFLRASFCPYCVGTTNADGANPVAGLILSGDTLFGTASAGGIVGSGTLFAMNTNGTGFTNLHNFGGDDGANPRAGLLLLGNTLYGTTRQAGSGGNGTLFAVNTNGTGYTNLYSFTDDYTGFNPNTDGAKPLGGLTLLGHALYGTTSWDGSPGLGTLFGINTDGTSFTVLYRFGDDSGFEPAAGLIFSGDSLYGTAYSGGSSDYGTVFALSLPHPQLTLTTSGTDCVLTWPTNAVGFTLQSTTNLSSDAIWTSVGGQYAVTNPISHPRRFYRLIR